MRKADYVKFYTEVHNVNIRARDEKAKFVRAHIQDLLNKANAVFKGSIRGKPEPRRALALSVVDQLLQYDLLDTKQMEELVDNQKLFPANTTNPFFKDTWTKLKFHLDPKQILPSIQQASDNSASKQRAIRVGTGFYLDQAETNTQWDKANLAKLAEEIYSQTNQHRGFFEALNIKLSGRPEREKADYLINLSLKTERELENLLIHYARFAVEEQAPRAYLCQQLKQQHREGNRRDWSGKKICP